MVSFDNPNEDFWLQLSTDGGNSFTTVEEWNTDDEFVNDQRMNDVVTIDGPFTNTTVLRFRSDASGDFDYVYLDDIVISGCRTNAAPVADLEVSPFLRLRPPGSGLDGSCSFDPDGDALTYDWDFGDGNMALGTNDAVRVYTYANPVPIWSN